MHIPDGFVSGPVNIAGGMAAAAAIGLSAWRASRELQQRPHTVPLLATTAAFVFAAQMLNFPIGGGTSGHFLGAAVVAALLGPWCACLVMTLVLIIQCLGFADGGLSALGTNVVNMGVVAGFGAYLVMRSLRAVLPAGRGGYLLAAAAASWVSVVVGATACALELAISGTSPLAVVLPAMSGVYAVIGIGEALITTALLSAVITMRSDIVPRWAGISAGAGQPLGRRTGWALAGVGLAVALLLATLGGPLASGAPDGLERIAQQQRFIASSEEKQVWTQSPFAGYTVPGVTSERCSTGLAGLLGTAAIFALGFGLIKLIRRRSDGRGA